MQKLYNLGEPGAFALQNTIIVANLNYCQTMAIEKIHPKPKEWAGTFELYGPSQWFKTIHLMIPGNKEGSSPARRRCLFTSDECATLYQRYI